MGAQIVLEGHHLDLPQFQRHPRALLLLKASIRPSMSLSNVAGSLLLISVSAKWRSETCCLTSGSAASWGVSTLTISTEKSSWTLSWR